MKLGAEVPLSALLLGASLSVLACQRRENAARAAASSTTSGASPRAGVLASNGAASPAASHSAPPTALPNGCRVLGVKGVKPGAVPPPSVGTRLTGFGWFELADGVELAVKHGDTLREFQLVGPGRFLACPGADETVLVASGSLTTTAGAGARAGAVVTLATPFGVIEYPDAELRLEVGANKLSLAVKQGQAMLVPIAKPFGTAPASKAVRGPAGRGELRGGANTAELVQHCEELREQAGDPASVPSDATERARWAVARMQARRDSRLACEVARAATGRLAEAERGRFEAQLLGRGSSERGGTTTNDASGNRP